MKLTTSILTRGLRAAHSFCILHCAFCIVMSVMATSALADVTITDITARQRWPWNGLIDIDFTIAGAAAGETFAIEIDATAENGAKSLVAKTYASEPVAGTGANRVVWDLGADYPEFRANDLRISVTALPLSDSTPVYMVIDLAGGPTATKYPVRYTTSAPSHVQGAADEPCQTTELWMRRIVAPEAAFTVNNYTVVADNPTAGQQNNYWGKMTKDYYIGIFELTQRQWQLVMGEWPACYFTNELYRASRPVENLNFGLIGGTYVDLQDSPSSITSASFLGKIRSKTGLPINLPSNIQLNFAHRGGSRLSGGEFYRYYINGSQAAMNDIVRYKGTVENTSPDRNCDANSGTAYVGSYLPNEYGLYDAIGNVSEFTCERAKGSDSTITYRAYYQELFGDNTLGNTKDNPVIDPPGISAAYQANSHGWTRRTRCGGWLWTSDYQTLWNVLNCDGTALQRYGFRLSMTVE